MERIKTLGGSGDSGEGALERVKTLGDPGDSGEGALERMNSALGGDSGEGALERRRRARVPRRLGIVVGGGIGGYLGLELRRY